MILKPDAVPSVWPGCPSYLSKEPVQERNDESLSSNRYQREYDRTEELAKLFLESDKIRDFDDAKGKVSKSTLPLGVNFVQKEDTLVLYSFSILPTGKAVIDFSLTIHRDLSYHMFVQDVAINQNAISFITKNNFFETCSEILNAIAFLKAKKSITTSEHVDNAAWHLEKAALSSENEEEKLRLEFFVEQLRLSSKKKMSRRYSSSLLAMACVWMQSSPSLYRQIRNEALLLLPSPNTIKRLSSALSVDCGISSGSIAYLRARFSKLSEQDTLVNISIDEVFTSKRVEYASGICHFL